MLKIILILFLMFFCTGCIQPGVGTSIIPLPVPTLDTPIRSNDYYKEKYNIDLPSEQHDMAYEIDREAKTWNTLNSNSNIRINGKKIEPKLNQNRFLKSKQLGSNEYYLSVDKIFKMEKQIGGYDCWAACLKYIIMYKTGLIVSQEKIINKFKSKNEKNVQGATILDIMGMLGYNNIKLTPNGARHLMESLAENQPVIIGITQKDGSNHAIVVTGARYSFVNLTFPALAPSGGYSFIEFDIVDPQKGISEKLKASDVENKINFELSFNPISN